ncbi:hypothetical protein R3W88_000935 [Solanum pinnatisectum]|uniref:Uncharacterized protein n=1 Tax=Solanum pinnatisectum TaxID=50273 RepID=A0AAV9MHC2_9SOLN|nr:hypothetical protein R3W88_000935 [Solanum pinnatisectum]
MVTKNLVEREKYMILSKFTSKFSGILTDWWTAIKVFYGDTGQRREKLWRQLFEMKCISFDRDIIDIHFKKDAFLSSLAKMLAGHAMTIIDNRFKSMTIPHIGYIMQAIFQALDSICTNRYFAKNCLQSKRSVKTFQIFDDIADHTAMYLSRDDDLESILSLEDEPTGETLFSIDVYEMAGNDANIDDDPSHNMLTSLEKVIGRGNEKQHTVQDSYQALDVKWHRTIFMTSSQLISFLCCIAACHATSSRHNYHKF